MTACPAEKNGQNLRRLFRHDVLVYATPPYCSPKLCSRFEGAGAPWNQIVWILRYQNIRLAFRSQANDTFTSLQYSSRWEDCWPDTTPVSLPAR